MLTARTRPATWLFMVYMAGDNDLEGFALQDILELQRVGSGDDVCALVQVDRAAGHDADHGDWKTTRRYLIERSDGREIVSAYEDIGETNTGDPRALRDFIRRGLELCPAEHRALVIWNHGTGWKEDDIYGVVARSAELARAAVTLPVRKLQQKRPLFAPTIEKSFVRDTQTRAIAFDDDAQDFLDNAELSGALSGGLETVGGRLDLIGFDACLMSMIEVHYQIRDLAGVVVGSQELEPPQGWPYAEVLKLFAEAPGAPATDTARRIVDAYGESYRGSDWRLMLTQSAVRLDAIAGAATALDALAKRLAALLDDAGQRHKVWFALMASYKNTIKFKDQEYLDLLHLLDNMTADLPDPVAVDLAQRCRDASAAAVVGNHTTRKGRPVPEVGGLSIYWPMSGMRYSEHYDKLDFARDTAWNDFLKAYLFFRP